MKKIFISIILLLITTSAFADLVTQLAPLVGYTIIGTKTIKGWYDQNGNKGESFEGCNFGRVIVFDDNKILSCMDYNYAYEFQPTALLLSNGSNFKMIVGNDVYDMSR